MIVIRFYIYKFIIYNTVQIIYIPGYVMSHSWLLFGYFGTESFC